MDGQLSEHPFAELITEIQDKRFSGALRLERERVKAAAYFDTGDLLYATCNLRNLRLSEYAQKCVSLDHIPAADRSSDFALGATILARGLLTKPALEEVINSQVRDVLRLLLLWIDGKWSFDDRARLTQDVRATVLIKQLLLEAARRLDLQFVASRFPDRTEVISPGSLPQNLNLSASEGFLISRIETPLSLDNVVALSGMPDQDACRTAYGLILAGALSRQSRRYAWKAGPPAAVEARKPAAAATPVVATPVPPRDATTEITEFLESFSRATNHYEVLNIRLDASPQEIKRAYYHLARRFHPDRFHELANTALHTQLQAAFARITQAHEVLSELRSKATYDAKIAALKSVGYSSPGMSQAGGASGSTNMGGAANQTVAEQRFQEGLAALRLNEINTATAALSAAARLAPNDPRYRAYYGKALAGHPQTKRLAEAELQAAVQLDPNNAPYRVMLASLYQDLGFWRRAINELERALSVDSKNTEARRMLQSLESKK